MHLFDSVWLFGTSVCFYLKVEDPHAIHMTTSCRVLRRFASQGLVRSSRNFLSTPVDPGTPFLGVDVAHCCWAMTAMRILFGGWKWFKCLVFNNWEASLSVQYVIIDKCYILVPHTYIYRTLLYIISYIMLRKTDANTQSYQYKTWMIHEFTELRQEFRCGAWQGGWPVDDILVSPWCEEGYMESWRMATKVILKDVLDRENPWLLALRWDSQIQCSATGAGMLPG